MNMQSLNEIFNIIIAIVPFFAFAIKKINKSIEHNKFLENTINENTIYTLKLVIINKNMPLEERVECGRKYLELGGDGAIHELVNDLERELYNKYKNNDEDKTNF